MTKTGKGDAHWDHTMRQYANGRMRFGTGKKPGSFKWRHVLNTIDKCPRHNEASSTDLLGHKILCKCGYHEETEEKHSGALAENIQVVKCPQCVAEVCVEDITDHFTEFHTQVECKQCHKIFKGELEIAHHIKTVHAMQSTPSLNPVHSSASATVSKESKRSLAPVVQSSSVTSPVHSSPVISPVHSTSSISPVHSFSVISPVHSSSLISPVHSSASATALKESKRSFAAGVHSSVYIPSPVHSSASATVLKGVDSQQSISPTTKPLNCSQFLPRQFKKVIQQGDQAWIAKCLYDSQGKLKESFSQNWFYPPSPTKPTVSPPDPHAYFRRRLFVWAPMRMWGIPLKCPQCKVKMHHSGIYPKVREVIDMDTRYYLVGADYPRCSKCVMPICPWSSEVINQLDPAHRYQFPAVLTTQMALDKKCVGLMKPRTAGNSSSFLHQALEELHSSEWARRVLAYLAECELHKKGAAAAIGQSETVYEPPPAYHPLPLAQWFQTAHTNEILAHLDELKSVITSTYGRIIKLDSTKKITKKLAGDIADTATWMTNIGNEYGQVLNCVLTTGEGAGLEEVCQGIVRRYQEAGIPEPEVLYVDRDCCSGSGVPPVLAMFHPWKTTVRLDVFHFMRRFTSGLTTEHHPLFGMFCSKMSSCIFEWDKEDISKLREAKKAELKKKFSGLVPTDAQITASINSNEMARHCRRKTRSVEEMQALIGKLLKAMWDTTDTTGLRLINPESMARVWEVQQKHLSCIQDAPHVQLYTKIGQAEKGGKFLDVLKCGRGSSSLESFHHHQCNFIPGWRCNAVHTQMYMMEGCSRWNVNRSHDAVEMAGMSKATLYDVRMMSSINNLSTKVLGEELLPEFKPPGKPTDERIAVEYLLAQSGKGDLRDFIPDSEIGTTLPDIEVEDCIEDELMVDATVCKPEDIDLSFNHLNHSKCDQCGMVLESAQLPLHIASHFSSSLFECCMCKETFLSETMLDDHMYVHSVDISMGSIESKFDTEASTSAVRSSVITPLLPRSVVTGPTPGSVVTVSRPESAAISPTPGSASNNPVPGSVSINPAPGSVVTPLKPGSVVTPPMPQVCEILETDPNLDNEEMPEHSESEEECFDVQGRPGWKAVDQLAAFLVGLNRTITALSTAEAKEIVRLYSHLDEMDKTPPIHSPKSKKRHLPGPWRSSRKRSGSAPGQQAAERLYLSGGVAAERPDVSRISECICLHLSKQYKQARDRPRDLKGKILPTPQAIVQTYSHIQQLVVDSELVMKETDLMLVTINNTTVIKWLHGRQKRADQITLLQGVKLPEVVTVAREPLLQPMERPSAPVEHSNAIKFDEPVNREGESPVRPRKRSRTSTATSPYQAAQYDHSGTNPPVTSWGGGWQQPQPYGWIGSQSSWDNRCGWPGWPNYFQPPAPPPPHSQPHSMPSAASSNLSRFSKWRRQKAEKEDQERMERGEAPGKRYSKVKYAYDCTRCHQPKTKQTGHTQSKGRWYCPSSGLTLEEWRQSLPK